MPARLLGKKPVLVPQKVAKKAAPPSVLTDADLGIQPLGNAQFSQAYDAGQFQQGFQQPQYQHQQPQYPTQSLQYQGPQSGQPQAQYHPQQQMPQQQQQPVGNPILLPKGPHRPGVQLQNTLSQQPPPPQGGTSMTPDQFFQNRRRGY